MKCEFEPLEDSAGAPRVICTVHDRDKILCITEERDNALLQNEELQKKLRKLEDIEYRYDQLREKHGTAQERIEELEMQLEAANKQSAIHKEAALNALRGIGEVANERDCLRAAVEIRERNQGELTFQLRESNRLVRDGEIAYRSLAESYENTKRLKDEATALLKRCHDLYAKDVADTFDHPEFCDCNRCHHWASVRAFLNPSTTERPKHELPSVDDCTDKCCPPSGPTVDDIKYVLKDGQSPIDRLADAIGTMDAEERSTLCGRIKRLEKLLFDAARLITNRKKDLEHDIQGTPKGCDSMGPMVHEHGQLEAWFKDWDETCPLKPPPPLTVDNVLKHSEKRVEAPRNWADTHRAGDDEIPMRTTCGSAEDTAKYVARICEKRNPTLAKNNPVYCVLPEGHSGEHKDAVGCWWR